MKTQIAVLMAAHKAEDTIQEAVDSLTQSSIPVDVYIVDDCSPTPVSSYLRKEKNVHVIRLDKNVGPANARNRALEEIFKHDYKYIAVMDADDISHIDRFPKQIKFLEENQDIAIVGTWARAIHEETGELLAHRIHPVTPAEMKKCLYFESGFTHSTLTARAEVFKKIRGYNSAYPVAQDYELIRHMGEYFKLANLPEYLMDYRISMKGITQTKAHAQRVANFRVKATYFKPLSFWAWVGMSHITLRLLTPTPVVRTVKRWMGKSSHIMGTLVRQ